MKNIALSIFMVFSWQISQASDLIEVLPLTDHILMLHFDDGYISHHGYNGTGEDDKTFNFPLNVNQAELVKAYSILSADDANFSGGISPTEISRKSKGTDFSRDCQWDGSACQNDYIQEHWIYLFLPKKMQKGNHYTLYLSGLADNGESFEFLFDENEHRSEAVHVNQIGYLPEAKKYAYVSHWLGNRGDLELTEYNGNVFTVINVVSGQEVFSGQMQYRAAADNRDTQQNGETPNGNFAAAEVYQCDFSTLTTPGSYKIVVNGIGSSFPFDINADIYREVFYYTARGVHYQRAGFDHSTANEIWDWPADHHPGITPGFNKLYYSSYRFMDAPGENGDKAAVYAGIDESFDINAAWGWYHDAGDWDGYPSHFTVPAYLLTTYELFPQKFKDGELNIKESGNGVPDIVDEGMWLLHYWQRAKGPTGGIAGARVAADLDDTGKGDGKPSWQDPRKYWIVYGEDPAMSYRYAAIAAQAAWIYQQMQTRGALGSNVNAADSVKKWKTEAVNAYSWAKNNTLPGDEDIDLSRYGAGKLADIRAHAAAALLKLSGETTYQNQFAADERLSPSYNGSAFGDQKWAIWTYTTIPADNAHLDATLQNTLIERSKNYADDNNLDGYNMRGWRHAGNEYFPILIGQATTPMVMESVVAYYLSGEQKYLDALTHTADYMLGGNPLNMTWVTGLGERNPRQLLNLDSWYDRIDPMVDGLIPYGPHRGEGNGYNGPWDVDFAQDRVYPNIDQFPAHERWFENRYCPIVAEYTVHQNLAPGAAIYGALTADNGSFYQVNKRPSVSWNLAQDNYEQTDTVKLSVNVNDDLGIAKVSYFQNGRFIATVEKENYEHQWAAMSSGSFRLEAVAYDSKGRFQTSDVKLINVSKKSNPPGVSWISPGSASQGSPAQLLIDATDDGNVQHVKFYAFNNLIEEVSGPDFSTTYTFSEQGIVLLRAIATDDDGLKTEAVKQVIVSDPTGLDDAKFDEVIYPNAADTYVNVPEKFHRAQFQLFDLQGKKVKTGIIKDGSLSVKELRQGTYHLVMSNGNDSAIYKLMKQ